MAHACRGIKHPLPCVTSIFFFFVAVITLQSYVWPSLITSGAIQYGVPTNEFIFKEFIVTWPATPKSHNCTRPLSVSRMLAAVVGQTQEVEVRLHIPRNQGSAHMTTQRVSGRTDGHERRNKSKRRRDGAERNRQRERRFVGQ